MEPHGLTARGTSPHASSGGTLRPSSPVADFGRQRPKRTLLAYSAEAGASAAKAGRQGYGGYPPRIHPRVYILGLLRRRVKSHDSPRLGDGVHQIRQLFFPDVLETAFDGRTHGGRIAHRSFAPAAGPVCARALPAPLARRGPADRRPRPIAEAGAAAGAEKLIRFGQSPQP